MSKQQTKREVESVPEVSRKENPAAWALATWTRSQSQAKKVNDRETKKKVEFTPEVVTEVRTRPKFDNEKSTLTTKRRANTKLTGGQKLQTSIGS